MHLTHPLIISFSFRRSSPPSSRSQCTAWTGPTHLAPFHRTLRKHRSSPSPPPLSTNTFGPRKPDTYPSPAPTPPSPPTSRTMMLELSVYFTSLWCFEVLCHRIHTTLRCVEKCRQACCVTALLCSFIFIFTIILIIPTHLNRVWLFWGSLCHKSWKKVVFWKTFFMEADTHVDWTLSSRCLLHTWTHGAAESFLL